MGIEVSVVGVFTDENGKHGNPLGIVDASTVAESDRQAIATELDYSENIFINGPDEGGSSALFQIFHPAASQIGRAPCRERGCKYVKISTITAPLKQQNKT